MPDSVVCFCPPPQAGEGLFDTKPTAHTESLFPLSSPPTPPGPSVRRSAEQSVGSAATYPEEKVEDKHQVLDALHSSHGSQIQPFLLIPSRKIQQRSVQESTVRHFVTVGRGRSEKRDFFFSCGPRPYMAHLG